MEIRNSPNKYGQTTFSSVIHGKIGQLYNSVSYKIIVLET